MIVGEDQEILEGVSAVLRDTFHLEANLTMATRLAEVVELDSLKRLRLAVALEDRFDIVLERADEAGLDSMADLVSLLRRHIHERAP
jgi:acyl carrier protein